MSNHNNQTNIANNGKESGSRKLTDDQMLRVRSCAILYAYGDDKRIKDKIADIATAKQIDYDQASIAYVIGTLRNYKRFGHAGNYNQALDMLEAYQVGDRGCPLTRTVSQDNTQRQINRINRINKGLSTTLAGTTYVYDYDIVTTIGDTTYTVPHITEVSKHTDTVDRGRGMGKVLGTLYTQWESKQASIDPAKVFDYEYRKDYKQVQANLMRFFTDYCNNLSKLSKTRLQELITSTVDSAYLTSRQGRNDPQIAKLSQSVKWLHSNFPHKDSITCREYIDLIRSLCKGAVAKALFIA
jgi:hypothetical protein